MKYKLLIPISSDFFHRWTYIMVSATTVSPLAVKISVILTPRVSPHLSPSVRPIIVVSSRRTIISPAATAFVVVAPFASKLVSTPRATLVLVVAVHSIVHDQKFHKENTDLNCCDCVSVHTRVSFPRNIRLGKTLFSICQIAITSFVLYVKKHI